MTVEPAPDGEGEVEVSAADDALKLALGLEDAGGCPAQRAAERGQTVECSN